MNTLNGKNSLRGSPWRFKKKLFIKKTLIKAMHHVKYQIVATQNNKDINEANCIFFHNLQHELKLS